MGSTQGQGIDPRTVRPLPGFAVIELDGHFKTDGSIVLPDKLKNRRGFTGKVLSVVHTTETQREWNGHSIAGRRVWLAPYGGRPLNDDGSVQVFSVRDIMADVTDAGQQELSAAVQSHIKRCRFCGPAKSAQLANMVLVDMGGKLVCPRCGKDENGEK